MATLSNPTSTPCSPVALWLIVCIGLVAAMVFVGGYTRLSGSGLSITEWKPIHGVTPPLNEAQWLEEFDKYRQIPQYQQVNKGMTLAEFKTIFWPEYFHRLLGRLIGAVFLLPLLYFWWRQYISSAMTRRLALIFALGGLQGLMGWVMVHSGLSERLYVSHIKLAMHLGLAFLIGGLLMWTLWDVVYQNENRWRTQVKPARSFDIFIALLAVQIVFGALVAGLHGGLIYNTFPDMNGALIAPEAFEFQGHWWDNIALIQFLHRWTAKALLAVLFFWWWKYRDYVKTNPASFVAFQLLAALLIAQFMVGILTLINSVPLSYAIVHQMFGLFIALASVSVAYQLRKPTT